jgi:hypothetical protein
MLFECDMVFLLARDGKRKPQLEKHHAQRECVSQWGECRIRLSPRYRRSKLRRSNG